MSKGAVLPVVVNVANTGTVAGDEIVMVWVSLPEHDGAAADQGAEGLRARAASPPGEEKQVTIPVRLSDLDYFQVDAAAIDDRQVGRRDRRPSRSWSAAARRICR